MRGKNPPRRRADAGNEEAKMSTKRLFGVALVGFTLALGCAGAQAMQADDPTIVRLLGVNELAQGGASAVEFVEGRAMASHRYSHTVPVSATTSTATVMEDQEASYYRQDSLFAFLLAGIAALALAGFALINKAFSPKVAEPASRPEAWRDHLFEMIEADLMQRTPQR
jgi:hypothetical protein